MTTESPAPAGSPRPRSVAELLLSAYASILAELRRCGVVRSGESPLADYAAWLVARALGGTLARTVSERPWDLLLPNGRRVQVEALVLADRPTGDQLCTAPSHSWDFDLGAFVLFRDRDYWVYRAALVPREALRVAARPVQHVGGWRVQLSPALLGHPDAEDLSERLRAAAGAA